MSNKACPFCGDADVHCVVRVYAGPSQHLKGKRFCFVECLSNDHRTGDFWEEDMAAIYGPGVTMQDAAWASWNQRLGDE